ncbi:helix-turn-helix domain-containing protein [Streptomyces scabiei]|uniref:transcriptional regulator n=1 Tax=Streptomyces scabiei TaxID=1930 RepID=UPI002FF002D8
MSAAGDDVQRFAASLTRLKERTDRSYGQLARRLNMNTSTLHRYCAGGTVPLDFAPVERFAVLCGATGEERLELHRLWLSAMAARQRVRGAGPEAAGTEPTGPPAAAPGPSPETAESADGTGGSGAATGRGRAAGASTPAGVPEPAGAPESAGSSEAAGPSASAGPSEATAPTSAGRAAAAGASEAVAGAGPAGAPRASGPDAAARADERTAPESDLVSAPAAGRRPWHRRRRTLVSAAVVAVLLASLGGIAALPSGDTPADRSARGDVPAPFRTTAGAQRPSTGPTSPSLSPDVTSTPSDTASPPPDEPRDKATKGGAADEPRPRATGVPITWTANSQIWNLGCGHDYVIAKQPKEVPPPPPPQDAGAWAATQGAVHGRNTIVEVTVHGRTSAAVVLTALRVRVVGRTAPATGSAYTMDQGCGGRVTPSYFDVDLDKNRPIARPVDGADLDTPIPAVRFPYSVAAGDPAVLSVSADTESCDCQWYLELEWSSEGRTGTVRIDDGGRPFRTTGIKGLPRYSYATESHRWTPFTE